nr:hypothetical protein [uncultured Mediterranean phage uvMED]|tara:strand:+ start:21653 stop:22699 length:1047 start_codon:yes stop_codon:yes gene_type:complete
MSAEYIIDRFGKKVGLNPSDENQRFVILDFLNEAMQSVYEYVDIPGALVEEEFYVAGNKRIAMSRDVQSIRAMREKESQLPWTARNLLSEYNHNNWPSDNRCWRIVGYEPLKKSLPTATTSTRGSNATGLTVQAYANIAATEKLAITFETSTSDRQTVTITPGAHTGSSPDPTAVTLAAHHTISGISSIRRYDTGNERYANYTEEGGGLFKLVDTSDTTIVYSEVPHDETEAQYLIVDVSEFPWDENSTQDDNHTLQILYKKKLKYIKSDNDPFPLYGFENIVMHKMMQLFLEEQGKLQEANVYDSKVVRDLGRKIADLERGQERRMQFGRHPHDNITLTRRYHYNRG